MTLGDMTARTLNRLGDGPTGGYYTLTEVGQALNCLQQIFSFLTLCFETTATFALATDGTASYNMLATYTDWILPLRIRVVGGAKLKPCRLQDLAALNTAWRKTSGVPERYSHAGFDFLSIYKQPTVATSVSITYAQAPAVLPDPNVSPSTVPAIQPEYHPALIEGAIPLLRAKEGGSEWQKTLSGWDTFMTAVNKEAAYVRARNQEQGYDSLPIENIRCDLSTVVEMASA